MIRRTIGIVFSTALLGLAPTIAEEKATLSNPLAPDSFGLLRYWQAHGTTPLDYLSSKFQDERWVVVGEYHRVRHDVKLIASLVPRLHETTDVRYLAMEFLCRDRTAEANRLVTAATYDRGRMIDFFRSQFAGWFYEEYLEIFHNTWASNRRLAEERGPFRLVGLHPCIDWETIHYGADPAAAALSQSQCFQPQQELRARPHHQSLSEEGVSHEEDRFASCRIAVGAGVFAQVTGEDPVLEPADLNVKPVEVVNFLDPHNVTGTLRCQI